MRGCCCFLLSDDDVEGVREREEHFRISCCLDSGMGMDLGVFGFFGWLDDTLFVDQVCCIVPYVFFRSHLV